MLNTAALVAINVAGNFALVPIFGIAAAGAVWGLTLVVSSFLPAVQAHRSLGLSTFGHPARLAALFASIAFIPTAAGSLFLLGQSLLAMVLGGIVGIALYSVLVARSGGALEFGVLRPGSGTDAAKADSPR